ncbi:MAG: Asp-tRNA(Asn)/Glu-tRNA(Gln) amidotransferase subunit GatA [Proteobacteria bacterium]|jgi:aspartyl-tRNA(Asn)/glutamyl-tRNA(Gln) amidotransferase subunit A|nr:Asp-tRNA(Asn)/Glu-tRNA(Gln) amidotransferase subunit GatA [Pseudomonadota bacterium]
MQIHELSAQELSQKIQSKEVSAAEVAKHFLERAQNLNFKLNAFISFNEEVLKEAEKIDLQIARGNKIGPLAGVPLGVKDMFCTQGIRTTAGSRILENFVPPYDSTVVRKLKEAGAIVLGKLNQDEFAMGSSGETSYFGVCKNPWDLSKTPGGSSGGSAAAQAAGLAALCLGTDTGGSIRQPASFCGVYGIKPTYGRVSRYGIVSYASSLDQAGPVTRTVSDAALALEVISGKDALDMTSSDQSVPEFHKNLNPSLHGKRIAVLKEYENSDGLTPDIVNAYEKAIEFLRGEGATVEQISCPHAIHGVSVYYLVATSEASSNLSRYDGVKYGHRAQFENISSTSLKDFYSSTRGEGFGPEVKRRIMLGTYCLASGYYEAYYKKASQVRRIIRDEFLVALQGFDALVSPVTSTTAFDIGKKISDPVKMYMNDIFTVCTNLAGLPGASVPVGKDRAGLPIGIQVQSLPFCEQSVLDVSYALELAFKNSVGAPHV